MNDTEIGNKYGVHRNTISNINRCITWTNLHSYKKNIRNEFSQKSFNKNAKTGQNNSNAKITEDKAKEIIKLLEQTTLSAPQIAAQLNVSLYIVEDIKRCRTWKYLHKYSYNIREEYKRGMI